MHLPCVSDHTGTRRDQQSCRATRHTRQVKPTHGQVIKKPKVSFTIVDGINVFLTSRWQTQHPLHKSTPCILFRLESQLNCGVEQMVVKIRQNPVHRTLKLPPRIGGAFPFQRVL